MTRQYLIVPATSPSPDRFFSRVGLVKTDLCGVFWALVLSISEAVGDTRRVTLLVVVRLSIEA